MRSTWHAISVPTNKKAKPSQFLATEQVNELAGVRAWCPCYKHNVRIARNSKKKRTERFAAWPGYILIRLSDPVLWEDVLGLDCVMGEVRACEGSRLHITGKEIAAIKGLEDDNFYRDLDGNGHCFTPGQMIAAKIGGLAMPLEVEGNKKTHITSSLGQLKVRIPHSRVSASA